MHFCEIMSKYYTAANKRNKYGQVCLPCLSELENIGYGKPDKQSNWNYGNITVPKQTPCNLSPGTPTHRALKLGTKEGKAANFYAK